MTLWLFVLSSGEILERVGAWTERPSWMPISEGGEWVAFQCVREES